MRRYATAGRLHRFDAVEQVAFYLDGSRPHARNLPHRHDAGNLTVQSAAAAFRIRNAGLFTMPATKADQR